MLSLTNVNKSDIDLTRILSDLQTGNNFNTFGNDTLFSLYHYITVRAERKKQNPKIAWIDIPTGLGVDLWILCLSGFVVSIQL